LVIIDEAQDIESSVITKSIFPMLASTLGTSCLIGSPKFDISDCYFYNVIQIAKDDPKRRHNYFRYDSDIVQEYNPRYKKFLQEQRASIGETSVEYQMSYKLVWPTERGMFITDDCFKGTGEWGGRGIVGDFDWIKEKRAGIQIAGIDWGKNNGDTVVTIGDVPQESVMDYDDTITFTLNIISMLLLHGDDYESQYGDVIEFLGNYGVVQLNVDATAGSVGDPLYDKLINDARLSHINIRGVPFTTPNKSRLYKQLQTEFQGGRIHIAGGPTARRTRLYADARKELIGLVKKHSNSGHLIVNKNPHKKNAKDDIPDSICLCLDAAKSYFEEGASAGENMFFAPTRIRRAQNNSVGISRGRQLVHIRG